MVCSPSQGKLSKVEWLGLESRLKMTAGGWYHTRMFRESSEAAGKVLSGLLPNAQLVLLGRALGYVQGYAHPGAEWDSQLRGAVNEQCPNRTEERQYEMPPREGMSIAQFLTVADIERSAQATTEQRSSALAF